MKKRRSLKGKLRKAFALLVALIVVQGIGTFLLTQWIHMNSEKMAVAKENALDLETAITAKYSWSLALTRSVYAQLEFTGELDSSHCALGQWMQESKSDPSKESYRDLIERLMVSHDEVHQLAVVMLEKSHGSILERKEARELYQTEIMPELEVSLSLMREIQGQELRISQIAENNMQRADYLSKIIGISMTALIILLAVWLSEAYIRSFMPAINRLTELAGQMSQGISVDRVDVANDDEIGVLANAFKEISDFFEKQKGIAISISEGNLACQLYARCEEDEISHAMNRMVDNLNQMIGEVVKVTGEVSTGARHMAEGAQLTAQGASEQAATVEHLASTITTVALQAGENARLAVDVAKLNRDIRVRVEQGMQEMDELVTAVKEIQAASSSIEKVMKIIDDIAYQTNILALNAAVEASRAGIHGRGFAVVADEVRTLAARSAEAARNTGRLLNASIDKSELGAKIADTTHKSLGIIVDGVIKTSEVLETIASSSQEQEGAIGEIHVGLDHVSNVVQQNSATAEEAAASSEEMFNQAEILNQLISRFTVRTEIYEEIWTPYTETVPEIDITGLALRREG